MKGEDGIPIADEVTHPGLLLAFDMAAEGDSDREIAQRLSQMGFKTAGNQLNGAFSKDTLRGMLTNRFYLGEIPDGDDGWLLGKHEPLVELELWDRVQLARQRNRTSTRNRT